MLGKGYVTQVEFRKHKRGDWRTTHGIWNHIRNYVPGWGYSKAEINAFFEGESGGKKQVHWDRITSKPGTYPPSAHSLASHSTKAHSELTGVTSDLHHAQLHAAAHLVGAGDALSVGVPVDISTANSVGTATNFARRDHVHKHPSGLGVDLHHSQSHTLGSHSTKAHNELSNVTSDQHHAQAHTLASHSTKPHSALTGVTANQHHAQAHTLASHSTKPHSALTGVTSDQHHAKVHALVGAAHSDVGLTIGHVIRATGATTRAWAELQHSDVGGVGDDDHHAKLHAAAHKKTGADEIDLDELGEPADNINLNVSIARHGLFPKLSNDGAQCLSGTGAWLTLYDSTSIIIQILSKDSANLRNSNDAEVQESGAGGMSKNKETKMGEPTGLMTVRFEMKSENGDEVFARTYLNGVADGALHSTTSMVYVEKEDALGPFASQDLVQIYMQAHVASDCFVKNFRFYYDRSINMLGDCTLVTPITITKQVGFEFNMQNQDP